MSTDIRATKQAIADNLAATQAAQLAASNAQLAADNAQSLSSVNSSGIQDAITNMNQIAGLMVQKFGPASIAASAFTLNAASGYYEYVLTHNLNDEAPEVNVVDAQRERQLIQDTGIDENSVKLELAPEDMTSNAWPLYVTVLGKPGSTIPNANLFKQIQPAGAWYRLLNGTLDYSLNGTTVDVPMVFLTVSEAFMLTIPGTVWVKLANGTYYTFNGATPELPATETTQAVFDSRIGFPDRVAL